jgi:hypothetical protein
MDTYNHPAAHSTRQWRGLSPLVERFGPPLNNGRSHQTGVWTLHENGDGALVVPVKAHDHRSTLNRLCAAEELVSRHSLVPAVLISIKHAWNDDPLDAFRGLLEEIDGRSLRWIVCRDVANLTRNAVAATFLLDSLKRREVLLIDSHHGVINTREKWLCLQMSAATAEIESRAIAERIMGATRVKAHPEQARFERGPNPASS